MENDDYDIILIEDLPCNSKDQLFARERYYTNEIECVNIRKNQGRCLELGKTEYDKLRKKEYLDKNIETMKIKHKEYYDKNIETMKIKNKEYRDENKEKLNEKFTCLCGGKFTHNNQSIHIKTKKHLKYLEE